MKLYCGDGTVTSFGHIVSLNGFTGVVGFVDVQTMKKSVKLCSKHTKNNRD